MPNIKIGDNTLTGVSELQCVNADDTTQHVIFYSAPRAILAVTAPAGSTIDVLQNSIVLQTYTLGASETSHSFKVDVSSTLYTVRATLGSKTDEQEVLAKAANIYDIKLWFGRLPYGYHEVEYIEDSGTQYINSGIYNNGVGVSVNFKINISSSIPSGFYSNWFGSESTNWNQRCQMCGTNDGNTKKIGIGYADLWTTASSWTANVDYAIQAKLVKSQQSYVKLNGVQIYSGTESGTIVNYEVPIFARWSGGELHIGAYMKLYYFKLYNASGTLVRDFIPCKTQSNAVGLCDLVSKTFFGNSGTGSFIAGPEV